MSGFHHDELADVNLITDNLRDRYKDQFSILKELIQNADDAQAKNLRFGLIVGDSQNAHHLLRGPGLVLVNDGPFCESDFRAICSFGLNSKAGEPKFFAPHFNSPAVNDGSNSASVLSSPAIPNKARSFRMWPFFVASCGEPTWSPW